MTPVNVFESGCGPDRAGAPREVDLDIVIPVYNEQAEIASSVLLLRDELGRLGDRGLGLSWQIVIADNASTDRTWDLARDLARDHPATVRALRIPEKGRGRALKLAWGSSRARVRAYMDVDLSTDIAQIPDLVLPIFEGRADVAFGSRLLPGSEVRRCLKREIISRTYNFLLRRYLKVSFHDAQCGFKAMSAEAAAVLLPRIADDEWFFDTELLVRAERLGLASAEIPVRWCEDPGSTVHIVDTVRKDLAGMRRLRHEADAGRGGFRADARMGMLENERMVSSR
ncbi:MAG: dolichyl-phosphate beta-glucosyltransferase [Collinsella sp.]|nr:dolichyl-phosphate beta-glucosyltransferase [Collinsella sp.]